MGLVNRLTEGVEPIAPAQDETATPVVAVLEPQLLTDDAPAAPEPDTAADEAPADAPAEVIAASGVIRSPRPRLRPAQEAAIQASPALRGSPPPFQKKTFFAVC